MVTRASLTQPVIVQGMTIGQMHRRLSPEAYNGVSGGVPVVKTNGEDHVEK